MLTRRDALKTAAAGLVSFILPAPRRHVDLMTFCGVDGRRYDCRLPYCLEDFTYATDTRICVRVRPEVADRIQNQGKMPPFSSLSFNHDQLRGWRPLPRLQPTLAADSDCPTCEGSGYKPGVYAVECVKCGGSGEFWKTFYQTAKCTACAGKGCIAPCEECHACKGNAFGVFPSLVELDGRYFDVKLYEKARLLGGEFVHDNWNCMADCPMLKFQFAGGSGLLMGMNTPVAAERVRAAKGETP